MATRASTAWRSPFHHTILPLASAADRRVEIRWGLRDFELRFGRPARGMWLPEAAVDLPTLRLLAEAGVEHTILAPWQAGDATHRDTSAVSGRARAAAEHRRRPVRPPPVERGLVRFAGDRRRRPLHAGGARASAELGGLRRTTSRRSSSSPRTVSCTATISRSASSSSSGSSSRGPMAWRAASTSCRWARRCANRRVTRIRTIRIAERTSWSCHHGRPALERRLPLRGRRTVEGAAASRVRATGGRDRCHHRAGRVRVSPDRRTRGRRGTPTSTSSSGRPRAGRSPPDGSGDRRGATRSTRDGAGTFLALMEAQRWRLAMFASDGWYWDDPARPETASVLRAAARAARLIDGLANAGPGTPARRRSGAVHLTRSPDRRRRDVRTSPCRGRTARASTGARDAPTRSRQRPGPRLVSLPRPRSDRHSDQRTYGNR